MIHLLRDTVMREGPGLLAPVCDTKVTVGETTFLIDYTIAGPAAEHVATAAKQPGYLASEAEKRKKKHLVAAYTLDKNLEFVPFAIECGGTFGGIATSFIKTHLEQGTAEQELTRAQLARKIWWAKDRIVAACAASRQRHHDRALPALG